MWWCTFSGGGGGAGHSQTQQERGLGAKNHETEHDGSISGALCETTVDGDGGRW